MCAWHAVPASVVLILEHLKRFQAGQDRIEHKLEEIVSRLGNLEISIAIMRRDFAHSEENAVATAVGVGLNACVQPRC